MDGIDNYQHNPSQSSRQLRCLKSKGEQRRRSFCGFGILLVTITLQKNYRETESKTLTARIMKIVGFFVKFQLKVFLQKFREINSTYSFFFLLQKFREIIATLNPI